MALKAPQFSGAGTLTTLEVDGTTIVVDETNDRVGIGTATPAKTLSVDGDMHFQPTASSTAHVTTAGSLKIQATNNIRIGDDGADSIRLGRINSTACKVHLRSGSDTDLVVTNGKVGIGTETPTSSLEMESSSGDLILEMDNNASSSANFQIQNGAGNSRVDLVMNDGSADTTITMKGQKVGILDTSPSHALDVNGDIRATGTLYLGSTAVTSTATELNKVDGATAGTVVASKAVCVDVNKDITGFRNVTLTGELDAATLDISGNADIDGILEADAITVDGVALNEYIADTVGAMVGSNTETNVTVTYEDGDNTLDFVVGTLNQDTTGTAAIATTVTVADESSDTTCFVGYVTAATGDLGIKTGSNLTFNSADGTLTATSLAGTLTTASQTNITGVGTISAGTWQGTAIASAYLDADTAHLSGTQTFTGAKTFSSDVVISGTTPQLTIGDAGAEDTLLVFDGNAADFRIGIDDGTDTLEIGVGAAHGTTPVIKVDSATNCQIMHNSAVADGEYSGDLAMFEAGEDLTAGEVVYFKSDGKVWKAVATAEATARCVAMSMETTSANAMGPFLLKGFARFNSEFPTYNVGGALYTPEAETSSKNVPEQTAPDSDGDFVQVIGFAISADAVWFDPDSTVVEVA